MELGIRLSAVAGMVQKGNCIADIGCDHAFVSIALVQNCVAERMIACDINKGPLEHAKDHIRMCELEDRIETRLCDGLSGIKPGECDGGIIAGMGGPLGLEILYRGREVIRDWTQVVLQLQSKLPLVRYVLKEWGFETVAEDMVFEDGKFYPIMRLSVPKKDFYEMEIADLNAYFDEMEEKLKGEPSEDVCAYTYGKLLLENHSPILLAFLGKEETRLLEIAEKLDEAVPDGTAAGSVTGAEGSPVEAGNLKRIAEINAQMDTLMMAKWKLEGC